MLIQYFRGDWKLKQIIEILAEIHEILRNSRQKPAVVLCGDLNSQPHSSLVQFLLNKKFDLCGIRSRDIAQVKTAHDRYASNKAY